MSAPATAKAEPKARWARTLESAASLADDLAGIGEWVGPRTGALKRSQGEKEDFVLRRLLVAWKEARRLRFPVEVRANRDAPREPDFVLAWPDGESLGVEVTEAGKEDYQAWLTETDSVPDLSHVPFKISTSETTNDLAMAIRRKVEKFDEGCYRSPSACDLVVYDNTVGGWSLNEQEVIDPLRRRNDVAGRFRQVHVVFRKIVFLDVLGTSLSRVDLSDCYEIDYANWVFEQVERLRKGATNRLDLAHIAEELGDLGRSERRALASYLRNLLVHLLKWEFQPERRSGTWRATIEVARSDTYKRLTESPSLRGYFQGRIADVYGDARRLAEIETGLPRSRFPEACPYDARQLLDPEFLPGVAPRRARKGKPRKRVKS